MTAAEVEISQLGLGFQAGPLSPPRSLNGSGWAGFQGVLVIDSSFLCPGMCSVTHGTLSLRPLETFGELNL